MLFSMTTFFLFRRHLSKQFRLHRLSTQLAQVISWIFHGSFLNLSVRSSLNFSVRHINTQQSFSVTKHFFPNQL